MAFFEPARTLYAKAGFEPCGPFGTYADDPLSTFMTMTIPRHRGPGPASGRTPGS